MNHPWRGSSSRGDGTKQGFPQPLGEEVLVAERKIIRIGRYKNQRGEYLRITEVTDRGSNVVIIPFVAAKEFHERWGKLIGPTQASE